jgi:hypothetical protein
MLSRQYDLMLHQTNDVKEFQEIFDSTSYMFLLLSFHYVMKLQITKLFYFYVIS